MTCQNEYKPGCIRVEAVGIMYANYSKDVIDCLGKSRSNNDPTVCFLVEYRLGEMRDCDECEQDHEKDCSALVRTKCPLRMNGVGSC
jgi:hypothetical protein